MDPWILVLPYERTIENNRMPQNTMRAERREAPQSPEALLLLFCLCDPGMYVAKGQ